MNGNAQGILRPRPVKPINSGLLNLQTNGTLQVSRDDVLEVPRLVVAFQPHLSRP